MKNFFILPLSLFPSSTLASFVHRIRRFFWGKRHTCSGQAAEVAETALHSEKKTHTKGRKEKLKEEPVRWRGYSNFQGGDVHLAFWAGSAF